MCVLWRVCGLSSSLQHQTNPADNLDAESQYRHGFRPPGGKLGDCRGVPSARGLRHVLFPLIPLREVAMSTTKHPALISGILLGGLFLGNAMINHSHAWPLVWPVLGGALAVYLAAREGPVRPLQGIGVGAKAGLIGLAVILFVGTPLIYLVARSVVEQRMTGLSRCRESPWWRRLCSAWAS